MPSVTASARRRLADFELKELLVVDLGWDRMHGAALSATIDGEDYALEPIAEKRGFVAYLCPALEDGAVPPYATRRKVEGVVAQTSHEHLIVFVDATRTQQLWQWMRREPGRPRAMRTVHYSAGQTGELLLQRLNALTFTLEDELDLTIAHVRRRASAAFDVDRVTRRFYERFQQEHEAFLGFVTGIEAQGDAEWYASLMLNRLMFVYFLEKKGFLDKDTNYLRNRLESLRSRGRSGEFLSFYRLFLLRLFHEGLGGRERSSELEDLLGTVPYLNGGIFDVHELETKYPDIEAPDAAFERVFDFFDQFSWHLDERPLHSDNEINPDVLGYIFEKYINQKLMGAYYTKEDITRYITEMTVLPILLRAIEDADGGLIYETLKTDPLRYVRAGLRAGLDVELPAMIAAGSIDVDRRQSWDQLAVGGAGLPRETWREVVDRRSRVERMLARIGTGQISTIDDLTTANLDLSQLLVDILEQTSNSQVVRVLYDRLRSLSILDPTCGSGAFLFAAMNILEPLYQSCLDRMAAFVADEPAQHSDLQIHLQEVDRHPNRRFFILKTIAIRNLFGVDIMEEAVEICKLRLFLKLVAQVEDTRDLEPLPDIDFNVRAGNTLVGFASDDQLSRVLSSRLALGDADEEIRSAAASAADAFSAFLKQQEDSDREVPSVKPQLRAALQALRDRLDEYLAGDYGVTATPDALVNFRASHQPFHWSVEFYAILQRGGFDAIVGNPPYVELRDFDQYEIRGFSTLPSGNLYALVLERCFQLCAPRGRVGMIVPVSSISTDRYETLQNLLTAGWLMYSSYDDRPSRLFENLEHSRLTIHVAAPDGPRRAFATRYHRWSTEERPTLFDRHEFVEAGPSLVDKSLPKISSPTELLIVDRLRTAGGRLGTFVRRASSNKIFYSRKVGSFLQVLDFVPKVYEGGELRPPSEFKALHFDTKAQSNAALCLLNSNLFYWFTRVVSDCRHLNKREVVTFPVRLDVLAESHSAELAELARELSSSLQATSEMRRMGRLEVQAILPRHSKEIIDRIDRVVGDHYGMTPEEIDFMIAFDLKYRVGVDE